MLWHEVKFAKGTSLKILFQPSHALKGLKTVSAFQIKLSKYLSDVKILTALERIISFREERKKVKEVKEKKRCVE